LRKRHPVSDQGNQYTSFIEAERKAENDRRESVNTRAASALTGATGLVTLVLAVFAVLVGRQFTLSGWAKVYLVAALLALLASAISAVCAGLPWRYKMVSAETLDGMLNTHWGDSEVTARGVIAYCNAVVVKSLRTGNAIKARFLIGAGVFQLIAVAALGLCTLAII
jgi:hypothetical protein